MATTAVTCTDVSLDWPDGTNVFTGLSTSIGPGRTGLIGNNGSGKSTLLRLLAGRLHPTSGAVSVNGELAYLPQDVTLDTALRVDEALGIAEKRRALRAIESGEVDDEHLEIIGTDWDVEERARATLGALGLGKIGVDRSAGELSGGETTLLRLAALLLRRPEVLMLDEPTNNLDIHARRHLHEAVRNWRDGVLIVVSHDRELLEHVDRIAELRDGGISFHSGGFSAYEQAVATQQEAAERALRAAESDERKQERARADAQVELARRKRRGRKAAAQGGIPPILAGARQRAAQESAGKLREVREDRLHQARERRREAEDAVREDAEIRVDLPGTAVPAGRGVVRLRSAELPFGRAGAIDLDLRGPERVALLGSNGAGKTTLLRILAGQQEPATGHAEVLVPARLLPQRLDVLDDDLSIVENVGRSAPEVGNNEIRAQLARFLFRGARADQRAATLSGGERLRAALAGILLAKPAPQLLMLDEPTNNLDLASVRQLSGALESFRGTLVAASHDLDFLRSLRPTRWLLLDGTLQELDPDGG